MKINRELPGNKQHLFVLTIYSGHSWVFDLEKKSQIEGLFFPNESSTLKVLRNKIVYESDSPFGLSDSAIEQLLRPLMLVTDRRYGAWINEGHGYTESELRDLIDESMTSEVGLDDLFGDLGVAPALLEQMLDDLSRKY